MLVRSVLHGSSATIWVYVFRMPAEIRSCMELLVFIMIQKVEQNLFYLCWLNSFIGVKESIKPMFLPVCKITA